MTLAIAREVSTIDLDPALGAAKVVDLAHGKAGRAVFFHYLAQATGDAPFAARADELIDEALDALADTPLAPSFLYGLSGIAWAYQHLGGDPDVLAPLDELLLEHVSIEPWAGRCDVAVGLAGYGLYLASRPPSPTVERALAQIERHLVATAVSDEERAWWTPPAWSAGQPIEHGISGVGGIASYLAAMWPRLGEPARALLPKALAWVWEHRGAKRWFEPSIVATLVRGAQCLDDARWWERGRTAARELARAPVSDPSVFHGAAGIAHVLHRVARATSDAELAAAAADWYTRLLALRVEGAGLAGFTTRSPDTGEQTAYPGILLGAAGVGLVLVSAWSDVEPAWDAALQLDVAPA